MTEARAGAVFMATAAVIGLVACGGLAMAQDGVFFNEFTVRPQGQSESIELFNRGTMPMDLAGWVIEGSDGTFEIQPGTVIQPEQYLVLEVGEIQGDFGGVTSLIDTALRPGNASGSASGSASVTVRDQVSYGQVGSAPLPPAGMTLARAPDAAIAAPPVPSAATDGLVWTIDPTPTFGGANDAAVPAMGTTVLLNELDPDPGAGNGDMIELFNPGAVGVDLDGWSLVNGAVSMSLTGIGAVPAGGFVVIEAVTGFELEETGLAYLFAASGARVDQLGFHDAPALGPGECYLRCPDGAAPYLGYSYATSGGGTSFFPLPCSPGESNAVSCQGVTSVDRTTWGRIKYRSR